MVRNIEIDRLYQIAVGLGSSMLILLFLFHNGTLLQEEICDQIQVELYLFAAQTVFRVGLFTFTTYILQLIVYYTLALCELALKH